MTTSFMHRLASAPISWGVCEVPGWGAELPFERVLAEMAELELVATEFGSPGYFPADPAEMKATIGAHGLEMIGGFVPLVLHDPSQEAASIAAAHDAAATMSAAGGTMFVTAPVTDWEWGPRPDVDDSHWRHMASMFDAVDEIVAEYGMTQAMHPHVCTMVETDDDVQRVLDLSEVGWTFDMGHLLIGGTDPLEFAKTAFDRIRHVHLKDVVVDLSAPVLAKEQSIMDGVQAGMFCNLGRGDVPIGEIITHLETNGYDQWYVLEQDAAITGGMPAPGEGPILDVQASIEYLRTVDADLSSAANGGNP